jgi:hypothetical protein
MLFKSGLILTNFYKVLKINYKLILFSLLFLVEGGMGMGVGTGTPWNIKVWGDDRLCHFFSFHTLPMIWSYIHFVIEPLHDDPFLSNPSIMWVMLIVKGFLNQSNIPSQMGANYKRISWSIAAENKKVDLFLFRGSRDCWKLFVQKLMNQEMHNFLIWHLKIM